MTVSISSGCKPMLANCSITSCPFSNSASPSGILSGRPLSIRICLPSPGRHQIAHNRNLVVRHGPNLHQIQTLHGILAHSLLLGIETYILSHHSCWRSYRPRVSFLLTPSKSETSSIQASHEKVPEPM